MKESGVKGLLIQGWHGYTNQTPLAEPQETRQNLERGTAL